MMKVDTTETRHGVRIFVAHDDSDSLVVVEVSHMGNNLGVRTGLRGNFDTHERPMRWVYTSLHAPLVSASERIERLLRYVKRRERTFRSEDYEAVGRIIKRLRAEQ